MRTTVTIDPDTEHLLRAEVARTGYSFKQVLNQSIRCALSQPAMDRIVVEPIFQAPFPVEFAARSMNRLADEWDDEETIRELTR
ncbi:MAG: antitoxin [Puniceicoccaceae bacterium]|nr:MAG: antitoxin [Puniceicoccaceae bacterium]